MGKSKVMTLPENWSDMLHSEQLRWFSENFGTEESDEFGRAIYDVDNMSDEIYESYVNVVERKLELEKEGFLID